MSKNKAYPLSNYTYDSINKPKFFKNVDHVIARLKANYEQEPRMTTTVEAILLVHDHNHLHILLLKVKPVHKEIKLYKLPGGRLKPGENEIEGLKRKLTNRLGGHPHYQPTWQIGQCVAVWWRPTFDHQIYPYCPPHVTKPKECKKVFIVTLPPKEYFAIPKNLELVAVPLFELFDNIQAYGVVMANIPQQISGFGIEMVALEEITEEP